MNGRHIHPWWRRLSRRERLIWAAVCVALAVLGGSTAYALATPTYTDQCVRTVKANGGIVLDCDPIAAAPSPSPSGTPSPTPTTPSPSPTQPPPTTPPPTTAPPTTPPVTTPPSPTPTGVLTGCLANPGACGYPDATSAGAHGTLAAYTGPTTITTAGTVVHDVAITGCLIVTGQNVTLRNVTIQCSVPGYVVDTQGAAYSGGTLLLDHVTVVCPAAMHGGTAFGEAHLSIVGADISGCENGVDADGSVSMTDSYLHGMFKGDSVAPAPHTDGIQVWPATATSGPIVFSHNTVLMHDDNSAFTSGSPNDPSFGHGIAAHLAITNNLLDGGSYTVYCSNNVGTLAGNRFGPLGPNHTAPWEHADSCGNMAVSGNVEDTTGGPALIQ